MVKFVSTGVLLFVTELAYAGVGFAPTLILPSDGTQGISKDAVTFSWKKADNLPANKVLSYRLLMSESARFEGYVPSEDACNSHCVVTVIDAKTNQYSTKVERDKSPYFWKVQAITTTGMTNWSNVYSFTTSAKIVIPSLVSTSASPSSVDAGNPIAFSAVLSDVLPSGYSVKIDYGKGLMSMLGSGKNYSVNATPTNLGTQTFKIGVYDSNGNLKNSQTTNNSFTVTQPYVESAPTLSLSSASTSVTKDASYSVTLQANDSNNNLSSVAIDWGDGSQQNSQSVTQNSSVVFNHVYTAANKYSWTAIAYDSAGQSSDTLVKTVTVNSPVVQVVVPTLKQVQASPSSTASGNSVTFSASLSSALPSGYSVYVDFGNGWYSMTGSNTVYQLSQTISRLGLQTFKVGVFDNFGTLKGTTMTGTFEIVKANSAPTLSISSGADSISAGTAYNLQFQANDSDGNLSGIQITNWGDGASESKTASNGANGSFSHTFNNAGTYTISANAYDSAGLTSQTVSKTIMVNAIPATNTSSLTSSGKGDIETFISGDKTFSYTKIANDGSELPKTAQLGSNPKDWACTKDNNTGLIWEVKTDDGGLRDKDWYYSWYKPEGDNSGNAGYTDIRYGSSAPNCSTKNNCNTYAYTNAVNQQGLCGKNDWRMPTIQELSGLLVCSDGKYKIKINFNGAIDCTNYSNVDRPTINKTYFPDITENYWFWSSSPNGEGYSNHAWIVDLDSGGSYNAYPKNYYSYVRLMRSEQTNSNTQPTYTPSSSTNPISSTKDDIETFVSGDKTFSYTKIANDGSELPKTAQLGSNPKDWACTKDNNTGLIWEVKTTDGGLRDKDWYYSWYNPDSNTNGGWAGYTDAISYAKPNCSTSNNCNTYAYTNAVNQQGLCGKKDWRLPDGEELMSIIDMVNTYKIDINYFPNTKNGWYWSSSPYSDDYGRALYVNFGSGGLSEYSNFDFKLNANYVRLVRG